jgi:hypothetical protein
MAWLDYEASKFLCLDSEGIKNPAKERRGGIYIRSSVGCQEDLLQRNRWVGRVFFEGPVAWCLTLAPKRARVVAKNTSKIDRFFSS